MSGDGIEQGSHRAASDWMIALQEQPDDRALQDRFAAWRRVEANDRAWRDLQHVRVLIGQAARRPPPVQPPAVVHRWGRAGRTPFAAVGMAACAVALLIGTGLLPIEHADLATGTAEMRTMRLADGSRVTLAPRSAIALAAGPAGRQVRLLRGAAYFDVRHDAGHPFRVLAGGAIATDLGTAFEVRHDGDSAHVAVREGLVQLSCEGGGVDAAPLRPGQTQDVDCAAGLHRRGHVAPMTVGSWTGGQLVVSDRPLAEVVAALRPWHRGLLIARGRRMTGHVTGVYDLRDPDRALTAIGHAHGATIKKITPLLTIVSAD